jgi:hypothetical protein
LGHTNSLKGIEPSVGEAWKYLLMAYLSFRLRYQIVSGFCQLLATNDLIPALADQSLVPTDLTTKNVAFRQEKKRDDAFKMIKKLAASIRLLQRIDYESGDPVWLIADASRKGVGGCVAQGPPIIPFMRTYNRYFSGG